jgi:hypothetical protein
MNSLSDAHQKHKSIFKKPSLYSSILIAIAAFYAGFVLFSRWDENRTIERRNAAQKAEQQRAADRRALEQLGGKDLAIQTFYAAPGILHRGASAQLCYGVANAKIVTLDPPVGPVWPSYARCLDVSPTQDTIYTLRVQDAAGNTKSQTVEIKVR